MQWVGGGDALRRRLRRWRGGGVRDHALGHRRAPAPADLLHGWRDGPGGVDDDRLGELADVGVVRVRLVGLEHRELRIVTRGQALVAEDATDLVDATVASDQQSLEVQLDGDPQVDVGVQRVPVRPERHGMSAPGDELKDGGLDLQEIPPLQGAPDAAQQLGPVLEVASLAGARHQVVVALAVAGLLVLEPVELLGGLAQRLDERGQGVNQHGRLPPASAHQSPGNANDVAEVEEPDRLEGRLAQAVLLEPDLHPAALVLQVGEDALALDAVEHEPAGDHDRRPRAVRGRGGLLPGDQRPARLLQAVVGPEVDVVDGEAKGGEGVGLSPPFGHQGIVGHAPVHGAGATARSARVWGRFDAIWRFRGCRRLSGGR